MNITRLNYEEYFLLYVDNELNIVQRKAVESFVAENPDLREELEMLQDAILPADDAIVFQDKASLLRTSAAPNPVNETNCEEYFILYADDELTNEQKDQVEQFVYRHPQHQAGFELLQKVKLMPDTSVVFPDKYALYRHEEEEKRPVVAMRWYRMMAAAAVLLLVGGTTWYLASNDQPGKQEMAVKTENSTKPAIAKKDGQQQLAVVDSNKTQQAQAAAAQPSATDVTDTAPATQDQPGKRSVLPADKRHADYAVQSTNAQQKLPATKKVAPRSNIQDAPNVTQIDNSLAMGNEPKDPKESNRLVPKGIDAKPADVTEKPNTSEVIDEHTLKSSFAVNNDNNRFNPRDNDIIDVESTGEDNRKNKMRGFFRKVSRVFDKATNADPDQTKNSIRIASFEIALK